MSKQSESAEKLERLMNETLRGLPSRAAPSTLESRVFGELLRRAALPWWRRSFAHWPLPARAGFVLVCFALIASTVLGGASAMLGAGSFTPIAAQVLLWMKPFLALMSSAGGLAALLVRIIPPLWIYGALAVGALLYVTLFGLGAAAYRALYLRPSVAGERS
jgi:hypothetical protein